jgi:hypothetical protein
LKIRAGHNLGRAKPEFEYADFMLHQVKDEVERVKIKKEREKRCVDVVLLYGEWILSRILKVGNMW